MAKDPNLPSSGDKPTERDVSDLIPGETGADVPDDWDDVGPNAKAVEENELPRREQMNVDISADVRRAFKDRVDEQGRQMRFVVEDLIRLYLDRTGS